MKPVAIAVTSDFICPWCWIGHQHLKAALQQTSGAVAPVIHYLPYELNPNMRKEGMNRRLYRSTKFGSWARSQAMDADVTAAGERAGIHFDYERVVLTPNTRLAHRLMFFAQRGSTPERNAGLYEAIFQGYFSEGKDIGNAVVLADIAASVGFERDEVITYLAGGDGEAEVANLEAQAQASFVRSVPTVRIGDAELTGAQPAYVFAGALNEAARVARGDL